MKSPARRQKMMNDLSIFTPEIAHFLVVYEQKSINGAARKIGSDAGNISRTIHKLEKSLGASLFSRHQTGLNPTELCDRFYASVISAQNAFSKKIASDSSVSRRVRIGFYSTIAYSHFSAPIIQAMIDHNLEPEFTIASSIQLVEMIKKRELDFVISHNSVKFPGLITRNLASEGIALCSKSGNEQKILLLHSDMLGIERIIQSLSYEKRWLLKDYFVIGKLLERNDSIMGLLPETLVKNNPALKVIRSFPKEAQITALSWPGSIGLELLRSIRS